MSLIPRFDCKWNYQLVVVVEKLLYSFESIEFFQRWEFKIFGNWNVLNTMFWCDCKMKVSISRCWKRFSIHLIQLSFFFLEMKRGKIWSVNKGQNTVWKLQRDQKRAILCKAKANKEKNGFKWRCIPQIKWNFKSLKQRMTKTTKRKKKEKKKKMCVHLEFLCFSLTLTGATLCGGGAGASSSLGPQPIFFCFLTPKLALLTETVVHL